MNPDRRAALRSDEPPIAAAPAPPVATFSPRWPAILLYLLGCFVTGLLCGPERR